MDIWLCDETPREPRAMEIAVEKEKAENTESVWIRMRDAMDKALVTYPEARIAVIQAIEEEFITGKAA